jgi:hypothetical protein
LDDSASLIIKQIESVYESEHSTGQIRCPPRNPVYTPFQFALGKDARIIGRVAQRSRGTCGPRDRSRRVCSAVFFIVRGLDTDLL